MAKLPANVIETIGKLKATPIATATPNGVPNLVYIGCFRVLDEETIEIADNKFFKTRHNLEANPVLAITVWDPEGGACFQIKGSTELVTDSTIYDECSSWVQGKTGGRLTPKAAVLLHVEEVYAGAERLV